MPEKKPKPDKPDPFSGDRQGDSKQAPEKKPKQFGNVPNEKHPEPKPNTASTPESK